MPFLNHLTRIIAGCSGLQKTPGVGVIASKTKGFLKGDIPWGGVGGIGTRSLLSFGQPTLETHAEFFGGPMEIMPGLFKEELKNRRSELCNMVLDWSGNNNFSSHLIFIPASRKKYMSENIPYPFRQNSNFLYLSGSFDSEALIVLCVNPTEQMHMIFVADPDPMAELWDGPKTSVKSAVDHYGFDRAFQMSEFDGFVREISRITNNVKVWCEDKDIVEKLLHPQYGFELQTQESPKAILDSMRVIKSPSEITLIRQSCKIASEAFQQAIKYCAEKCSHDEEVLSEHQIWAKIDYECRIHGADRLAYPPVVASGPRANVIHYVFNSNKCDPKDLVLVDAGCEFFGYCSDITRTWPVSGKFSDDRHRSLYEMLLQVQIDLIKQVRPGISLDQLFGIMSSQVVKGLEELSIIKPGLGSKNKSDIALRFCPHHVSHHLGMDVHDASSVALTEPIQPGMVITIEPGIYIRNGPSQKDILTRAGKEFIGIAMRIEDDVLVTPDGQNVLSGSCPKHIEDIERWGHVNLSKGANSRF